jgi:hypothetical protein
MTRALITWWKARKAAKRRALFEHGYDYAAGALLSCEKTPLALDAEIDCRQYRNAFDDGMGCAINDACRLGIPDNRI